MGLSSVVLFDDLSVSSAPTIRPSTSSNASVCSSDLSTAATTLPGDVSVPTKLDSLQRHPHTEPPRLTTRVPPTLEIQNKDHIHPASRRDKSRSDSLTLEDALLWRPLHVLPHTPPPPRFSMDTPFDTASVRPTFSHMRAFQCSDIPARVFVKESKPRWPYIYGYGIDPSRVNPNKDLPPLPTNSKSKQRKGKRGWRAIRRTVSQLFQCHSKEKGIQENVPKASSVASDRPTPPHASKTPKSVSLNFNHSSASASLLSRCPQLPSCSSEALPSGSTVPIVGENLKQSLAYTRKQQLRRSHSFAGYPTVLTSIAIADEQPPPPLIDNEPTFEDEDDEEMDEIAQGFAILREVEKAWNIEPLPVLDEDEDEDEDGWMGDDGGDMDMTHWQEAFEMLKEVQKTWTFAPLNKDDQAFGPQGRELVV